MRVFRCRWWAGVKHYQSILHRGGARMRKARALVVARDGAVCRRCGKPIDLTLSGRDRMGLSLGHVVAVSDGGSDELDNLAPEHLGCNLGAGDAPEPARPASTPVFCGRRRSPCRTARRRKAVA